MKAQKSPLQRKNKLRQRKGKRRYTSEPKSDGSESEEQENIISYPLEIIPENNSIDQEDNSQHNTYPLFLSCTHLSPQRKCHRDSIIHFNPPEVKREYSLPEPHRSRRRNQRAHNLKNIANHILSVVSSNNYLTVKQIAFVLFQIMGHTSLGKQILQRQYPSLDISLIRSLSAKYKEGKIEGSSSLNMVIKNVRRRLYDALNVMMAADVLRKRHNSTFVVMDTRSLIKEEKTLDALEDEEEPMKIQHDYEYHMIGEQIKKMEKRLLKKRRQITEKRELLNKLTFFMERNQLQRQQNLFFLPLLAVTGSSPIVINMERSSLILRSKTEVRYVSDLDIIDMILKKEGYIFRNSAMQDILE